MVVTSDASTFDGSSVIRYTVLSMKVTPNTRSMKPTTGPD